MNKKLITSLAAVLLMAGVASSQAQLMASAAQHKPSCTSTNATHCKKKKSWCSILSKEEKHHLRAAKKAAVAANHSLAKKKCCNPELREAMIKVDSSVKAIFDKVKNTFVKKETPASSK